jgi:hypothetical protein
MEHFHNTIVTRTSSPEMMCAPLFHFPSILTSIFLRYSFTCLKISLALASETLGTAIGSSNDLEEDDGNEED